ncbi:molecular chaperone [Cronobacter sakazakii]|uniref:Molecular chaperone n=5 Tax=Cronobacter sakazakii TaxID=28141 RepID=A0A7V7UUV1_CROSK|nr:molecular chaperone [Cronobacter sakazakii]AKE95322.1 hypothetical protein CSK29544_02365 [Cronobacter sakazakii]AXW96973.2 molecular chaperone [Cronobacter sakazakii]EGT4266677.1 molecular chaperone [Cronobacter sakazakii]EGT4285421.1 molecular chaperone [Cronobacter sakazakii]EGT4293684.1 molecular chaperone [Cronobacter sakazakii]
MSASKLFSKTTLMTLLISGGISWAQGAQAADTVQMTMTGIIQAPAATASGAQTGVVIEGTRVIYQPGQKQHSLTVRNQSKERWLIESWVDSDAVTGTTDSASTPPFEVSPALFRLDPNNVRKLHIIYKNAPLPTDRESVYWITIKASPQGLEQKRHALAVAINQRMKLFYRPAGLKAPTRSDYQKVIFSRAGNTLHAENPTPYWITFYSLMVGEKTIDTQGRMLPPKGSATYSLPPEPGGDNIVWQVTDDRGGNSLRLGSRLVSQ